MAKNFCLQLGTKTYIMGILNITPDSFSDGGLYSAPELAITRALEIQSQGADIIDIGAQSTRPGAQIITAREEIERLKPVLQTLQGKLTVPVSVDTFYPETAEYALKNGAAIVNDVSGRINPEMAAVINAYHAGWVVMHNGGGAQAVDIDYEGGIINAVRLFFEDAIEKAAALGIKSTQICLDTGIGFGKKHTDNLRLLQHMHDVKIEGTALLTGASRKRVIGIATGEGQPGLRVAGTVAAHTAAIAGGTDIIRVHDIPEAVQGARMADSLYR